MVDRITRLDRRVGVAAVGVLAVIMVGLIYWGAQAFSGEGSEEAVDASMEVPAGAEDWMAPLPGVELGPDGTPIPQEELIARAVQATIEAMPTPTPLPTPNVAATLQAEMALNRDRVSPVIQMNPLDLEIDRDPYLTPTEMAYFRELGPRLWTYTRIWIHIQRILSVDVSDWDHGILQYDLKVAQALLEAAPERPDFGRSGRSDRDQVDPVVKAYADSVESGMTGVRAAVARLSDAEPLLAGAVGHDEREELIRIIRDVELHLADFDDSMSAYGCSVCGELFRREGG